MKSSEFFQKVKLSVSQTRFMLRSLSVWLAVPVVAAVSFVALSQSSPPSIPLIGLSADPLYAAAAVDKPALALALSVEFPTVGAQYLDDTLAAGSSSSLDATYSNTKEYLGYYDAESCYTYNKTGSDTPSGGVADDYKRFDRSGPAIALSTPDTTNPFKTSRMCSNAFSGNFLNWASNSAIDMLRLSLTGGDRYIDTSSSGSTPALTILQRAVIPNGDPTCMWNSTNFPAKQLLKAGGTSGSVFFGAVPTAMATAAGANDIWVGNTLNRIYFATVSGGGCGNTASYSLGSSVVGGPNQMGPITSSSASLPSDKTVCASENGTCSGFTGTKEIWYGANTSWKVAPATGSVSCANAVFGDPISGTAKKCYYRPYTGSWVPTGSSTGLNDDGFFYARVRVCNSDSSGVLQDVRDYAPCKKYPNGDYKPSGAIQKYSDQLRLAAFGYVMDQTASYDSGRYGGVLRAPMKYVGYSTFDATGVSNTPSGGNANAEWNTNTGVFISNPDNNTTVATSTIGRPGGASAYLSGVVSYVNQFGRTGSVAGRYKKYDPIGELHYESLRYLQGLAPSADAVSSITTDMYDGYPVFTSWTDPYVGRSATSDYSCVKSNIVVIGDIHTHDGNRLPSASAANNIPDIDAWRTVVQKFEKQTSGSYVDGQGNTQSISNPNSANSSVPTGTATSQIMGSAYWARTHDIRGTGWTNNTSAQRPGLRVKTFAFDVNEYNAEADATHRHTANQLFMAAKYGGFETDSSSAARNVVTGKSTANTYNAKGNPFYQNDMTTADNYVWQDTDARTSRQNEANTYFLQSDARGVLSAFDDIFSRATTNAGSIAGAALQNQALWAHGTGLTYQGYFDTSDMSGNLKAKTEAAGGVNDPSVWEAQLRLAALPDPATTRNIVVGNGGATADPVAAPFTWGSISTVLQTALDKASPTASADGSGQDRLNYIRGSRVKEGSPFRKRTWLLGDIVNSGVSYSGAPSPRISSSSYAAPRTPAVFVGANDGMLHAFNGRTGDELFAYIPSWVGPNLSLLTSSSYVSNHKSFVDGSSVITEAEVTSGNWKTVLVSGSGAGGQGVFALDVTDPSAFSSSKVMWEFTDADDADLGNVTGRPKILRLRTGASTYKWFAVFGSGVNNYANDGNFSTTGKPALFLLDLSKAAGVSWALGTNYFKISLPVDSTLSATKATGLINFSAVLDNVGNATQMYMGDLHGNLWKLDFSLAADTTHWSINELSSFNKGTSSSPAPYPLFIAKDSSGNVQPISVAPNVGAGPDAGTAYIVFGTGKYLEVSDRGSASVQSAYMVYDNGSASGDSSPVGASAISGRARLQGGATVNVSTGVITFPAFTVGRATSSTSSIRSGWYFDFSIDKERQIYGGAISGGAVNFNSLIPAASGTAGTCAVSGGDGKGYSVAIATGNGTIIDSTVGILGEPILIVDESLTTYTATNSSGQRVKTEVSHILQQGSGGLQDTGKTQTQTFKVGRLNWRQINNYQNQKNKVWP